MFTVRFPMSRFWKGVLSIVGFFVFLTIVLAYLIPIGALRQYVERQINGQVWFAFRTRAGRRGGSREGGYVRVAPLRCITI